MSAIFLHSLPNSVNLTRIPNPTLGSLASFHSHTLRVRSLFHYILYFPRCFRPQLQKTLHICNIIYKCVGIETDEKNSTIGNVTVLSGWLPHVVLQKYAYLELPQAVGHQLALPNSLAGDQASAQLFGQKLGELILFDVLHQEVWKRFESRQGCVWRRCRRATDEWQYSVRAIRAASVVPHFLCSQWFFRKW